MYSMFKQAKLDYIDDVFLKYIGDPPKDIAEAWDITFKKWELIVLETEKGNLIAEGGLGTCGLCMIYNKQYNCTGCPIYVHTGQMGCEGTEYMNYQQAQDNRAIADAQEAARLMLQQLRDIHEAWKSEKKDV